MLAIFGANVAAYSNPTELWQVRANETGMDVSNPSTWNTQLDPTNPWAADHGVNSMQQGAQRLNENAYNQANGTGPALNMVQGADGNWTNTNADANQLYLQNKINALNPSPTQPQGGQQPTQQQPNTPASFWNNATAPAAQTQNTPYPNPVEAWQVRANDAASGAPTAQDNFWAQANAPTNPASNNTMQASDFTYSGSEPWSPTGTQETTAAGMGYKQDVAGNWYNPNYQAPATTAQQTPVQPATQPVAPQQTTPSASLGLAQNVNGEWYNPNSTAPTSSNPNQSAIDAYMAANPGDWTTDNYAAFQKLSDPNYKVPQAQTNSVDDRLTAWAQTHPNGPQTDADWLEHNQIIDPNYVAPKTYTGPEMVSYNDFIKSYQDAAPEGTTWDSKGIARLPWDQFIAGANTSGLTDAQQTSLDNAYDPYTEFQKYQAGMSGSGSWGANAHNEAAATKYATEGLAAYLKNPQKMAYTAEQLTPMLNMLQGAVKYTPTTTVDQFHQAQNDYYKQMDNAFGFDFSGSVAKTGSTKGALSELANYLANPQNLKRLNGRALGQLAGGAMQGATKHIGGAMKGDITYMRNHQQPGQFTGAVDAGALQQMALQQQQQGYFDSFGKAM